MARARFSVLPSVWYENGPMAALESLAAGLPLVGSAIGGIPEMIEDGVTGVVVPPGDPSALLSGLLRARALPGQRGRSLPAVGRTARRARRTHGGTRGDSGRSRRALKGGFCALYRRYSRG